MTRAHLLHLLRMTLVYAVLIAAALLLIRVTLA